MYRDIDVTMSQVDNNDAQTKYDELDGITTPQNAEDIVLLEFHCDLDIPGFEDKELANRRTYWY